jgi:regulator of sigma E protease
LDPVRLIEIIFFLGLVIFVHELGHFAVARWCGVLVERFSIGFGPVLLSFKRGDTEYAISAIPLGGYVKMLGQSDIPGAEQESSDPRSYQNKSVLQRMAIISAGVVMNILFGLLCFAVAYKVGVPYGPATVGSVTPGWPAWKAGLEPGDRIVKINGHPHPSYETFQKQVMFTRPGTETVHLDIERKGKNLSFDISPAKINRPVIGVMQSLDLNIPDFPIATPTMEGSPAAEAKSPAFERGDQVIAVNGQKVATYQDFNAILYAERRNPVTVEVRRKSEKGKEPATAQIQVDPNYIRTVGLRMTMGPITAVQSGSPAATAIDEAGKPFPIEADDVIRAVDGERELDPMRLADLVTDKAGQRVEITLLRKSRNSEEFKVYVTPKDIPVWDDFSHLMLPIETAMSIPSIGIAYNVGNIVHSVEPGSPAAESGKIQPGDAITYVDFFQPKPPELPQQPWWKRIFGSSEAPDGEPVKSGELDSYKFKATEKGWAGAFWGMQNPDVRKLKLTISRPAADSKTEIIETELVPVADKSWPLQLRGINFLPERKVLKADSLGEALLLGMDYTWNTMTSVYLTLRGLIMRDLDADLLSGPLRLGYTAYVVSEDFMTLVRLIGLINVNLAVVNFLPIPVLDGGHMVFLLYEGIFRRKPNERILEAITRVGFACILALMLFVIYLDIKNLFFEGM